MIDFHCHIDLYPSPRNVMEEICRRQMYVLSVTTAPSAFEGTEALIPPGARIRTALGLHPELAIKRERELEQFEILLPRTQYVGEVGLDGSKNHRETLARQEAILAEILSFCVRAGGRIITIHSRLATGQILDCLDKFENAGTFVLHWYLGTPRQIARATEMGCWFSVNPSMLASQRGFDAVQAMPRDRIVPESDGPFGMISNRPSYPWDSFSIIPLLSRIWHEPEQEVQIRMINAFRALAMSQFQCRSPSPPIAPI